MINLTRNRYIPFFLLLISFLLFYPFLGDVNLFDWDEANFAELAREMILSKNYLQPQINYLPFYEKPPLFIWFQVLSMKIFGINEFAARFPNAFLSSILIVTLFYIGKKLKDNVFGLLWVLSYFGSFLPFMYFRTGLIDPWFNFFMFLSLYFYHLIVVNNNKKFLNIILSALFLGLAVQTKGPVAFILVYCSIFLIFLFSKFKYSTKWFYILVWVFLGLFISSLWFLYEYYQHGPTYIYEFIIYQIRLFSTEDALHGGPIYYHFIVLLIGCFPASLLLLNKNILGFLKKDYWSLLMFILLLVVLILFSIVKTKIIHYSSMAYFPISYLAALQLYRITIEKNKD